jgi:hypothetical protein
MRQRWNWPRSLSWLALLAAALATFMLALVLWPHGTVTRANFQRIRVGMSQADLRDLLGQPEYDTVELGLVKGSETYSLNFTESEEKRRERGFRNYRRQQWSSSEITIIAISDLEGSVVCRYAGGGQRRSWLDLLRGLSLSF